MNVFEECEAALWVLSLVLVSVSGYQGIRVWHGTPAGGWARNQTSNEG